MARILPIGEGNEHKNPVILMVCEDITDYKQAEDALRESEQSFYTIANTADITERKLPEVVLKQIQEATRFAIRGNGKPQPSER